MGGAVLKPEVWSNHNRSHYQRYLVGIILVSGVLTLIIGKGFSEWQSHPEWRRHGEGEAEVFARNGARESRVRKIIAVFPSTATGTLAPGSETRLHLMHQLIVGDQGGARPPQHRHRRWWQIKQIGTWSLAAT